MRAPANHTGGLGGAPGSWLHPISGCRCLGHEPPDGRLLLLLLCFSPQMKNKFLKFVFKNYGEKPTLWHGMLSRCLRELLPVSSKSPMWGLEGETGTQTRGPALAAPPRPSTGSWTRSGTAGAGTMAQLAYLPSANAGIPWKR